MKYVKVFGERSSGTKFLVEFLRLNFPSLVVLRHETGGRPAAAAQLFAADYDPQILGTLVIERFIDQLRKQEFAENFGWKHACVSERYLRASPRFSDTFFLFIVRCPFHFLNSLHKRQHNLCPRRQNVDRAAFIRAPLIANERDNLDDILVDSPLVFWNKKNRAYLDTARAIPNSKLIRYEDLVHDPAGFRRWFESEHFHAAPDLVIPLRSTNGSSLSFHEYRDKTSLRNPQSEFSTEDIAFVNSIIDQELIAHFGYSMDSLPLQHPRWQHEKFSYL